MYPQADDPLTEQVWDVMKFHKGYMHRIDRDRLTLQVFGSSGSTHQRQFLYYRAQSLPFGLIRHSREAGTRL